MLRFARALLGILNILNWVGGLILLAFTALLAIEPDLMARGAPAAFSPAQANALTAWLLVCLIVTMFVVPLAHLIFTRLRAMIADTQAGEVFSARNVARLRLVAYALLGVCAADLVFGIASIRASAVSGEYIGWSPSLTPWLVAGLLFVLARIFAEGVSLRTDLEGTV